MFDGKVHCPSGPSPSSEFEHSSIPATIKKMFNLSANFLTHRDPWAGTFEGVVSLWDSPRTHCPEVLSDVQWGTARKLTSGEGELSEFQEEVVQLAAVLNGDHLLNSFPDEGMFGRSMKVKQAAQYVEKVMARFMEASIDASKTWGIRFCDRPYETFAHIQRNQSLICSAALPIKNQC